MDKDIPAFPTSIENHEHSTYSGKGMSLRDYFAAKAMQGFLMGEAIIKEADTSSDWLEKTAVAAYEMADAMLKARGVRG